MKNQDCQIIASIVWTVEDLKFLMKEKGIKSTPKKIKDLLDGGISKSLKERSIELGWEVLRDLI